MLLMGKLTISMAIFNSFLYVHQRVNPINIPLNHYNIPLNHYKIPLNHYKIPLDHYKIPLNHYKIPSSEGNPLYPPSVRPSPDDFFTPPVAASAASASHSTGRNGPAAKGRHGTGADSPWGVETSKQWRV